MTDEETVRLIIEAYAPKEGTGRIEALAALSRLTAGLARKDAALKRLLLEFDFMVEQKIISDVRNDVIFVEARAALGEREKEKNNG